MPTKTNEHSRIFISNVQLHGFKSIENISIDFQKQLNIIIGKNGSGKSNFMEFVFNVLTSNRNKSPTYNFANVEFVSDDNHSFKVEFEKELQQINSKDNVDERVSYYERIFVDGKKVVDSNLNERTFKFQSKTITYRQNFRNLFSTLGYRYFYPLYIKYDLPSTLDCLTIPGTLKIDLKDNFNFWDYPNTLNFITDIFWELEMSYDDNIASLKNRKQIQHSENVKTTNSRHRKLKEIFYYKRHKI